MEESRQEFLGKLCNLYLTAMFAVLPLYTGGTYLRLGDTKYLLFRNLTMICLGIFLAAELFFAGYYFVQVKCRKESKENLVHRTNSVTRRSFSLMDIAMLFCVGAVLLSFFFSPYRQTAWTGYQDWYMGALSQLLFVGIYFLVSRGYQKASYPIYLGEATLLTVTVIGLLQRLNFDPLGLHRPFLPNDWEKSHMLSTIGNINWLCGYYSVLIAFPVVGFLYGKRKWKTTLLYIVSVLSLLLLGVQGSDSGFLVIAICLGVGFLAGLKKPEFFRRSLLLAGGFALSNAVMALLVMLRGSSTIPLDGHVGKLLAWKGWLPVSAILFLLYFLMKRIGSVAGKRIAKGFVLLLAMAALAGTVYFVTQMSAGPEASWGNGRGALWKLALAGFAQADFGQKLVGVGPDGFAEYIYRVFPAKELIGATEHWEGAVFANAHNEWLNHLVNMGILGVTGYLAIFLVSMKRYRGMLLGVIAVLCYGAVSFVSFQQVMSTPYLFAILGLCEGMVRNHEEEIR